jgi:hypothetical protein
MSFDELGGVPVVTPLAFAIVESPARYTVCARFSTWLLGALRAVAAKASTEKRLEECMMRMLIYCSYNQRNNGYEIKTRAETLIFYPLHPSSSPLWLSPTPRTLFKIFRKRHERRSDVVH